MYIPVNLLSFPTVPKLDVEAQQRRTKELINILRINHYSGQRNHFAPLPTYSNIQLPPPVPDDYHSARRYVDDLDVMATLEQCFRIIHDKKSDPTEVTTPVSAGRGPVDPGIGSASALKLTITKYLAKFLKRSVFERIKGRQTRLDHNLFDVIWQSMKKVNQNRRVEEELNCGIIAPDYDVYVVFQEFLVPLIKDIHCMNLSSEFKPHPRLFFFPIADGVQQYINFQFDVAPKSVRSSRIEVSRNLDEYELPLNLTVGQIELVERAIVAKVLTNEFTEHIGEQETGVYYTLSEVLDDSSQVRSMLIENHLMIEILDITERNLEAESIALNGVIWPYGRGVFVSEKKNLSIWINVLDHFRLVVTTDKNTPANLGETYTKAGRAMHYLEEQLNFKESYFLGYLSSRPSFLGTGLKIATVIYVPNLMKETENLRHLCSVRGLNMVPNSFDNTIQAVNMQSLGVSEFRIFQDYCTAVSNIFSLEKDMSLTNSKQIAHMLVKIFKKKKNSII